MGTESQPTLTGDRILIPRENLGAATSPRVAPSAQPVRSGHLS